MWRVWSNFWYFFWHVYTEDSPVKKSSSTKFLKWKENLNSLGMAGLQYQTVSSYNWCALLFYSWFINEWYQVLEGGGHIYVWMSSF